MRDSRKIAWRLLLLVAVIVACGVCLWLPLVTFNDMPPWEAMDAARRHAQEAGYDVIESGGSGEYITQPDALGGCEVEAHLGFRMTDDRRLVVVRLRRSSALGVWRLVSVSIREQ